ncbi:MAG TPA: 30S ribosomal protein S20, partial [Bdellovibrionota bacterium]|nr:30S ribosomal protein S20 [Bdellovibrionota bacterium]
MPNTRQAAKRAARSAKRQDRNQMWKSAAKSALRKALTAIEKRDLNAAKEAYADAVKVVSKAASAGVLP